MVTIKVNNQTEYKLDRDTLSAEAEKALKKVGLKKDYEISLALVEEKQIKSINSKRRNENKSAGVLSFAEKDLQSEFYEPESEGVYLGEIFLCPSYIKKKTKKYNRNFKEELLRYFQHGVFHLAGLDHSEMDEVQSNSSLN